MQRGSIRQSYALVVDGNKGRWIGLIALALVVSALEALGATLVYALISVMTEPDEGIELPVVGDIRSWFPDVESETLLIGAAVGIGLFFVIRGILSIVQTYAQHRITYNAGARLATRLARGYLSMPYSYHLRHESSELVRNAISSVRETVSKVVLPAAKFVAELLVALGMIVVLFATAPIASLLVIVVLAPATYLVLRLVKARVKRYGRVATDAAKDSLRALQQSLHGIRDVRLLGREKFFVSEFGRARRRDAETRARQATFSQVASVLIETLLVLSIVAFLVVTVLSEGAAGQSFAILGLFAYVGMRLKPSIQKIIATANNVRFASPAIDDLYKDLEETADAWQTVTSADGSAPVLRLLEDSIRLEHVTFVYENSHQPALEDVSLELRAGDATGICGPTGGGKSTLVDIIVGLIEPTTGQVLVDEKRLHDHNVRSWHRQLGVVSQDLYLFDDSLRQNIALGVPTEKIDNAAVDRAIEMAQLSDFVATLPEGLDTRVGERGTLLSGGQRQRVSIARALYRDPEVLILDEGTSALDNETEHEFMEALERFRGKKTIILVAHRLTTIRDCDQVIFVDRGRASGGGTYDDLYEQDANFRRMAV